MKEKELSSDQILLSQKKEAIKERELLTDSEAADFLRCSTVSLWRARKKGLITFRRVMGKILYLKSDLLEFLERSKRGGYAIAKKEVEW